MTEELKTKKMKKRDDHLSLLEALKKEKFYS